MNMQEKITGNLDGTELFFKHPKFLKRFGFTQNQYLAVKSFPYKGTLGFTITGSKDRTTFRISDDPDRLFLSLDLSQFSKNITTNQMYEAKFAPGKITLHLLPEFDKDEIRLIISKGIEKINFKEKSWKSQKHFDGNTWQMYLQSVFEGLYTTSQMKCGMADKFNNLATRVSEAARLKSKPDIGVYIVWSESLDRNRLKSDILSNEGLNKPYNDGLIVFGKIGISEPYTLIGMSCHSDATAFKILREVYPDSEFKQNNFAEGTISQSLLAAAYLFPHTDKFSPEDSLKEIGEKVFAFAKLLQEIQEDED